MERRSNYDITRDRLERDFLQYDQEAMLRRVPLRHDADYLYLTFLRLPPSRLPQNMPFQNPPPDPPELPPR